MALAERNAFNLASNSEEWEQEPRYLLREIAALLPQSSRPKLLELWPKVLVQAERARTGAPAPTARGGKRQRA